MARMDTLPADAEPELAATFATFERILGVVPNSLLTMQRRPRIVAAFEAHSLVAAGISGVSEAKVAAIWDFRTSPLYDDGERAALEFALSRPTRIRPTPGV